MLSHHLKRYKSQLVSPNSSFLCIFLSMPSIKKKDTFFMPLMALLGPRRDEGLYVCLFSCRYCNFKKIEP